MPITRKFQLEVVRNRKVVETICEYVKDKDDPKHRKLERKQVERIVPEGYMVYFNGGQSIFVETKEELARMRLLPHHNCDIDEETGEPVTTVAPQDLKANVLRKTQTTEGALTNG